MIRSGGFALDPFRRRFLVVALPGVLLGTVVVLTAGATLHPRSLIGAALVLAGTVRVLGRWRTIVEHEVGRHAVAALGALGVLHGLTNLGGGVLTLVVGSLFRDKEEVRRQVAFAYRLMASVQLATLAATRSIDVVPGVWVALPALAAATHLVVGERIFLATGQRAYQSGLTALIVAFGVVLLVT